MFINIPCIENTKKENGLYSYELKFPDIIQENKKHIIQNSRLSENNKIDLSGTLTIIYFQIKTDYSFLIFNQAIFILLIRKKVIMNKKNISIEQLEMEKMSIHYMNQNYLIKILCVLKK